MSKYEYQQITSRLLMGSSALNELGADGWGLVSIVNHPNQNDSAYIFYFMRQIPVPENQDLRHNNLTGVEHNNLKMVEDSAPERLHTKTDISRESDSQGMEKQTIGFCFCKIGAGGKPCISREYCDAHGGTGQYVSIRADPEQSNE